MSTIIDAAFPVSGSGAVPLDHGYPLYSALSTALPLLHDAEWLGVHPLDGRRDANNLALTARSRLRLRLPANRIPDVLPLAGLQLTVAGHALRLGAPQINALETRGSLDARLVLIRLTRPELPTGDTFADSDFAKRFVAEAGRQLERLGISGQLTLCGKRRLKVADQRLLGFSVRVDGLDADASLRLQVHGLGGKRRMGCGLFRPTRERVPATTVGNDAHGEGT